MPVQTETQNNKNSDDAKCDSDHCAKPSGRLLRPGGGGKAPLAKKIPDTHAQMKRRCQHAHDKEREVPWVLHVLCDVRIRRLPMRKPPLRVEMPSNVGKRDQSRVALRSVKPIPDPGVRGPVGFAPPPNDNAIAAMKKHRQKNGAPLHDQAEWNRLQLLRNSIVFFRTHK